VTPLDRYYTSLDEGAFEDAAAAFTPDAVCMRPARDGSGGLETIRGRDAILATFRRRSGQPIRHEPRTCAIAGRSVLIEGRFMRNGKEEECSWRARPSTPTG
jgi:ketosteroid isomerase-like protein